MNTIYGKFIQYEAVEKTKRTGEKYIQHLLTFALPDGGVTDITLSNDEYIATLCQANGHPDLNSYMTWLYNQPQVPLYYVNNDNYVGFSLMQSFKENFFPNMMGQNVEILNVKATPKGVDFELADGTIAGRSFCKKIGDETYHDFQKQMRFIKTLNLNVDPSTFDLNSLKGGTLSYVVSTVAGGNPYLDVRGATLPQTMNATSNQPNFGTTTQAPNQPNFGTTTQAPNQPNFGTQPNFGATTQAPSQEFQKAVERVENNVPADLNAMASGATTQAATQPNFGATNTMPNFMRNNNHQANISDDDLPF